MKQKTTNKILFYQNDIKYAECIFIKYGELHVLWLFVFFPLEVFWDN